MLIQAVVEPVVIEPVEMTTRNTAVIVASISSAIAYVSIYDEWHYG